MTGNNNYYYETKQANNGRDEEEQGINYREILDAVILHWHWFVISIFVCLCAAFIYLKYKAPVYSTWTEVLIKEEDAYKRNMRGSTMADFTQLGFLTNSNGFDNEIEILGSKTLAKRVVTNLKLYVNYTLEDSFRDQELYGNSPLIADMSTIYLDTLTTGVHLRIEPNAEGYRIMGKVRKEKFEAQVKDFPVRVNTPSGWVHLKRNPGYDFEDDRALRISIYNPSLMANVYMNSTTIEPLSKLTTIASISLEDTQSKRAENYLNELIRVYNEDANEVKNEVALKTEAFVNKRIKIIDAELGDTEGQLEGYKKRNQLVNLTSDAEAAYKGIENYQKQQIELQTQMMLVKSLKEYVDNPANMLEVIPANLGLTDNSLNRVIADYNDKIVERKRLLKTAAESSPVVIASTNAITALYPGIRHSINAVVENLRIQKRDIDEQYNSFMSKLGEAPTQERVLADMGRQQQVKAALYQILLQKREENAISLASTVDKAQVIDAAESSIRPISPKKKIVALIALVLGIAIPAAWIYVKNLLRFRIEGRNDLQKLTPLPILSDIFIDPKAKSKRSIVVRENTNDMMEETFRNLRTNLSFVMKKSEKVLLCTSMIPGEGKTFVSTNLAMSMALMGKKVVVIGLDIRKPRLARLFGLNSGDHGITAYLAGEDNDEAFLKEQITNSGINHNLDVLPAGLIPPNPGELITSERLDQAFALLRKWYDFIIIDTPPLGLVSDTLQLARLADASIIVARSDYSLKRNFNYINELNADEKMPKMNLVLNGVDLQQRKYGYAYGYGKYGHYGHYGQYGKYGNYGHYGNYGQADAKGKGRKGLYVNEEHFDDND